MANALTSLGDKVVVRDGKTMLQRMLSTATDEASFDMNDTLFRNWAEVTDPDDLSKPTAELDAWEQKLREAPDLL